MHAVMISPSARSIAFAHMASRRRGSPLSGGLAFIASIALLLALIPSLAGARGTAPLAAPAPLPAPAPAVVVGS